MQALVLEKFGDVHGVALKKLPVRRPATVERLVRLIAPVVNPLAINIGQEWFMAVLRKLPIFLGDFIGIVDEVGLGIINIKSSVITICLVAAKPNSSEKLLETPKFL